MSLCRLLRVPAGSWPFPALSPRIFPQMLAPIPRWSSWCIYPFLPRRHRPSSRRDRLGNSQNIHTATPVWIWLLGAAVISLCSGLQVCSPPRSLLPQHTLRHTGQPWLLRPRISRFVTSPSRGYASRPNRATDGMGTFTPLDSRPCWPLPRCYLRNPCMGVGIPTPQCLPSAYTRFFLESFGLTLLGRGSAH